MKTKEELNEQLNTLKKQYDETLADINKQANAILNPIQAQIKLLEDILEIEQK